MGSQKSQIRSSDWAQHSTFTIAKTRKQPKGPLTYSWIKKYHIYIFFPIYSAVKKKKEEEWGFPGSPVVKNLPSNAEDLGLIPGQGNKILHAMEQLSP